MSFKLTSADKRAAQNGDYEFLNNKGVRAYQNEDLDTALEYYRLAAAMGSPESASNLGYCYMYGKGAEKNMDLAMAYFNIAAQENVIDALYKLGSIYESGAEGVEPDAELSVYYYQQAEGAVIAHDADPMIYPSLYFGLARGHMPGGLLPTDIKLAYLFLLTASNGYEICIENGDKFYELSLKKVKKLMKDPCFDDVRDEVEGMFYGNGMDFDE